METQVKVKWGDARVKGLVKQTAQATLDSVGLRIQQEAQAIAPHLDGHLEGSATTEPLGGGQIGVSVAFGGPAAMYAQRQHEIQMTHVNGRQWKYLETPFKANVPQIPRLLELSIRAAVQGV